MKNLIIDFETFSVSDIDRGAWVYVENVEDWFLTVKEESGDVAIYSRTPEKFSVITDVEVKHISDIPNNINTVFAHNANGFDRILWERIGLPAPKQWVDTMELCAYFNLPKSLDEVSKLLFQEGKIKGVKEFFNKQKSADVLYTFEVVYYSIKDVKLTEKLVNYFRSISKYFLVTELDIMEHTYTMNKNGIKIDTELAKKLLELLWKKENDAVLAGCNARSPVQLKRYLERKYGVSLPNVNKYTLKTLPLDETDQAVLSAARTTTKKRIERLFSSLSGDNKLRGFLRYYSAISGRASSVGFQIHNLPRPNHDITKKPIDQISVSDTKYFLRSVIIPENGEFTIADYSQIEARLLAWYSNETSLLEAFRKKQDIYKQTAAKLFGKPADRISKEERQIGKATILGCGYGMGAEKFFEYCKNSGVNLESAGISPRDIIFGYRRMYPNIPALWKKFHHEFFSEDVQNGTFQTVSIIPNIKTRTMILPSRRRIFYHDVQIDENGGHSYASFELSSNQTRKYIYGGMLVENMIQAIARDVCLYAALELQKNGFDVKFHVHDEIVIDGSADDSVISEIMRRRLPDILDVELSKSKTYNKGG